MGLRITGGAARGRVLRARVPSGVRPTGSRVREAVFSMVGHDLTGVRFLDAFAGSGLMGLEAWSRGASVVAVEKARAAQQFVAAAIHELDADVLLVKGDVLKQAARLGEFDLVYVDPPFALEPGPILEGLAPCVDARLLLEADPATDVPSSVRGLRRERSKRFGGVDVHIFGRVS